MKFILEYKSFYKIGDIVLMEYWYSDLIVPVKIVEVVSKTKFKVSHNIKESQLKNAPDEVIKNSDIIDYFR